MSNSLLYNLKFSLASAEESNSFVSLEDMLLRNIRLDDLQNAEAQVIPDPVEAQQTAESSTTVKGRKVRRNQLKGSKSKATREGPSKQQFTTRAAQIKANQDNNLKVLRNKKDNGSKTNEYDPTGKSGDSFIRDLSSNTNNNNNTDKGAEAEVLPKPTTDISYNQAVSPVILALCDFVPCFDSIGDKTADLSYDSILYKRAARMLNIDTLGDLDLKDSQGLQRSINTRFPEIPFAEDLKDHINARLRFFDSLKIINLPGVEEANSAFSLTGGNTSSTELLYTYLINYADSLYYSTPRLAEDVNDREIIPGPELVERPDTRLMRIYDSLRARVQPLAALATRDMYKEFRDEYTKDVHLSMKILTNIIGKEVSFSQNLSKNGVGVSLSTEGISSLSRESTNPYKLFNVDKNATRLPSAFRDTGSSNSNTGTGNNIVFQSKVNRMLFDSRRENTRMNYPFESSEVVGSDGSTRAMTAGGFIEEMYEIAANPRFNNVTDQLIMPQSQRATYDGVGDNPYLSPYEAASSLFTYAGEQIQRCCVPESIDNTAAEAALRPLTNILRRCYNSMTSMSSRYRNQTLAAHVLRMCGEDQRLFDFLLMYLAFRQEKMFEYNGTGSPPPGASSLFRSSRLLISNTGGYTGLDQPTTSTTFTAIPRNMTITPPLDGSGVSQNILAPAQETTVEFEQPLGDGDSGTLESLFNRTFEDICGVFAEHIHEALSGEARPQTNAPPVGTTLPHEIRWANRDIKEALMDKTGGGVFDEIIEFEGTLADGSDPIFFPDITSTSDRGSPGVSYYSGVSKDMMFLANTSLYCKVYFAVLNAVTFVEAPTYAIGNVNVSDHMPSTGLLPAFSTRHHNLRVWDNMLTFPPQRGTSPSDIPAHETRDVMMAEFSEAFPDIASTISEIEEEFNFLTSFAPGLIQYFQNVNRSWLEVSNETLLSVHDNTTLGARLLAGLVPSRDVVKLLLQYQEKLNSRDLNYGGKKLNDNTVSTSSFEYMIDVLSSDFIRRKHTPNSKVIAVGIPSGLLQGLESAPVPLDQITQDNDLRSADEVFQVIIKKIDHSKPNINYTPISYKFSRNLFIKETWDEGFIFTDISNNFEKAEVYDTTLVESLTAQYGEELAMELFINHTSDWAFKGYLDLQFDIDLEEKSFPMLKEARDISITKNIDLGLFRFVDTSTESFLSASNLAFDPDNRKFKELMLYNNETGKIDINRKDFYNPFYYSTFDYANSYGTLFDVEKESKNISIGTIFEKNICIAFEDEDFEVDENNSHNPEEDLNIANNANVDAQNARVDIGPETLDPTLISYEVYITLGYGHVNFYNRPPAPNEWVERLYPRNDQGS